MQDNNSSPCDDLSRDKTLYQNGFLVQHLREVPYGMEDILDAWGYAGLSSRTESPLIGHPDRECRKLSKEVLWREISPGWAQMLHFISDPDLLLRYLLACRQRDIPLRLLFVQSGYSEEIWTGPDIPKRFLGFEYSPVPIDNQIITDLYWYESLLPFSKRLNDRGLFPTEEEAALFKDAYDEACAREELGDGELEAYIFCLYEVEPEEALRQLGGNDDTHR